jgi:oxygen-independent coproporphyrinogen-3 oxidase
MCDGAADLRAAGLKFGFPENWYADETAELERMQQDGVLSFTEGKVQLSAAAAPLARVVAAVFDSYLRASNVRHSVAV